MRTLTARQRAGRLERAFGPMDDAANPTGQQAFLATHTPGSASAGGEAVLDAYGFNAEFVPRPLGGRLDRLDALGQVLRPVFRRDASLGFGYGLSCFFAAVPVWTAGTGEQRRRTARLLLEGRRLAVARHEVAHGNGFVRDEFTASPAPGGGFTLGGRKTAVANASRATGLLVFARTGEGAGGRSHSVLLLDRRDLPADRLLDLGRRRTAGMRGAEFGDLRAVDCPLPRAALVGEVGDGYELSLRSSLVIRGIIPSIVLAGADSALRTVARFAVRRRPDGRSSLEVRHLRDVLAGAFVDLLISDCLALVATRSLHLLPRRTSACAAATAYVAPKIIAESMDGMFAVLGEEALAEDGDYGAFHRQMRDLPVTSLGHTGSAGRQVSILPQLPQFARRSWFADPEPPPGLFRPYEGLPPLDLAAPVLFGDGDPLAATLVACADAFASDGDTLGAGHASPVLRFLTRGLVAELEDLRRVFARIDPGDRAALVSPSSLGRADRYTLVLAAGACLGVWREQRAAGPAGDAYLADPAWLTVALYRLSHRLGLPLPDRQTGAEERVLAEVLERLHERRSYDLYRSALA